MHINEKDQGRLDDFFSLFFDFLHNQNTEQVEVDRSRVNIYKSSRGSEKLVMPTEFDEPFILDDVFRVFVIANLFKMMRLMYEESGSQLFGFAERSLYEYITTWGYLFISDGASKKHTNRLKTLILAGHFRFIINDPKVLKNYLGSKGESLTEKDLEMLNIDADQDKFFDYQWKVAVGIKNGYGPERYEFYLHTHLGIRRINSHQNMRVHANPLSINEIVSNTDVEGRHQFLLALYARQVMDYFKHSNPKDFQKVTYLYDKFMKNHRIQL
jgi:hypothetical protein